MGKKWNLEKNENMEIKNENLKKNKISKKKWKFEKNENFKKNENVREKNENFKKMIISKKWKFQKNENLIDQISQKIIRTQKCKRVNSNIIFHFFFDKKK